MLLYKNPALFHGSESRGCQDGNSTTAENMEKLLKEKDNYTSGIRKKRANHIFNWVSTINMVVDLPISLGVVRVNSFVQPYHVWMPEMLFKWVYALTE